MEISYERPRQFCNYIYISIIVLFNKLCSKLYHVSSFLPAEKASFLASDLILTLRPGIIESLAGDLHIGFIHHKPNVPQEALIGRMDRC